MDNENKKQIETVVVKPSLSIFENETEHRLISVQDETNLDNSIQKVEQFMADNVGYGKPDSVKDQLYADAKILWNEYAAHLRDTRFTFYLNRKQYQFLTELLRDKLEYDVNTIFLAIELTNMLGTWHQEGTAKDDSTLKGYSSDATEITYMYHLISKHKVKGLSASTYLFAEVLRRIGEISKVINYYDNAAKQLSQDIQKWVAAFEDDPTSTEGKTIAPKKSKKEKEEQVS
jgi:hypothetical protein